MNPKLILKSCAVSFAASWLSSATLLAAPPLNDNFADRLLLSGARVSVTAANTYATREPGEPLPGSFSRAPLLQTVWWSWRAPADGEMVVTVRNSDFSAVVNVFRGAELTNLLSLSACPPNSFCSLVRIRVEEGTAYQIVVGNESDTGGQIVLDLAFETRPANDAFAQRIHLGSDHASATASNSAATVEPDEPPPPLYPGRTLWWSWTAPLNEPVTIGLESGPQSEESKVFTFDESTIVSLNIFTGHSLKTLTFLTNGWDFALTRPARVQVAFHAVAGTTYHISADGEAGFFGKLKLRIARTRPPLVILTKPINNAQFWPTDIIPAGVETLDPDGTVQAVSFSLRLYGNELPPVDILARPFQTTWTNLPPGQYELSAHAVDNLGATVEAIPIRFEVRPANDDFARRQPITGSSLTVTGFMDNASTEAADPSGFDRDIWWAWTAPASRTYTITVTNSAGYYPALAFFSGLNLGDLTFVAQSRFDGQDLSYSTRVVVDVQAGVTYPIAVDSSGGVSTLTVTPTAPPTITLVSPCDNSGFLIGQPVTFTATVDDDEAVSQVEFMLDDYLSLGVLTNRPFTLVRPFPQGPSRHRVRAWVTDNSGIATRSEYVHFEIWHPAPVNDNFADRIAFTGSFTSITGETAYATLESGDGYVVGFGSVWWAWTAPVSGIFTITVTSRVGSVPSLAVFTGSDRDSLALLTNTLSYERLDDNYSARVILDAQAGVTYPIAAWSGQSIVLSVVPSAPPSIVLTSPVPYAVLEWGDSFDLAAEAMDRDGTVTEVAFYAQGTTLLGVVTNRPFVLRISTTNLDLGYDRLGAIARDDQGLATVAAPLEVLIRNPGPSNDNFADRVALTGSFLTVTGAANNATVESGEPNSIPDGSVWWAWTAPSSEDFTITVQSESGYWPLVAVFTGSTLTDLNLIAENAFRGEDYTYSTRVVIPAIAGTTYPIAVGSPGKLRLSITRSLPPSVTLTFPTNDTVLLLGDNVTLRAAAMDADGSVTGVEFYGQDGALFLGVVTNAPFTLPMPVNNFYEGNNRVQAIATDDRGLRTVSALVSFVVRAPPPANDVFSSRLPLTGNLVSVGSTTHEATLELGEPPSGSSDGAGSVWWSWIAPASGQVTINSSAGSPAALGVYAGTNLTDLSLVARDARPDSIAQVVFTAWAGTQYQIAVAGRDNPVNLSLFLDARELRGPHSWPNHLFSFQLRTTVERMWIIEASTDMVDWVPIAAGQCADGLLEFGDPAAANLSQRFYRAVAVSPP